MRVSIKESKLFKFGNKTENILLSVFVNDYEVFDVDKESLDIAEQDENKYIVLKSRKHYLYVPFSVFKEQFEEVNPKNYDKAAKATDKQISFLVNRCGIAKEAADSMTLPEASEIIGKYIEESRNGN